MAKYLYVYSDDDYAALSYEQQFKGDAKELWEKAIKDNEPLEYEEGDLYFMYRAYELDEETMDIVKEDFDYDGTKHANYYKVG